MRTRSAKLLMWGIITASSISPHRATAQSLPLAPATMKPIATVDERFQSYNVEMLEVTGGKFWKPYSSASKPVPAPAPTPSVATPAGMDPSLYEYRAPINLASPRLRKLAQALGPAYIRVSGTWANTTYFDDKATADPKNPPPGFNGVLTQQQWKGVVDFSKAINAQIVTSASISPGARNAAGDWTPAQAATFFAYTHSLGAKIAAAEFMNEPNIAAMGGAPQGYTAAQYAKDAAAFRAFLKQASPATILLGPGSVAEGANTGSGLPGMLPSADLLAATGPAFDAFSFHVYPAVSARCARMGASMITTEAAALSSDFLAKPQKIEAYYAGLRDKFAPGKPLWITETAQAACGGDVWASTFADTFRYLDQLGTMARDGVQVVMHNTLAASDYGLLHEGDFKPRPNYWAAVLWRRLMGTTVLQAPDSPSADLHLYAHCLRGTRGGVSVLALNADRDAPHTISLPTSSEVYTLAATPVESGTVQLNGVPLELGANDMLPSLKGSPHSSGELTLAPATITFIALPTAGNDACR